MSTIPTIKLNDGNAVPAIAFGTGSKLFGQDCASSVQLAIDCGFTHLDGAQVYGNEAFLGEGIKRSGKARSELFIVTKLQPGTKPREVRASLVESLRKLGLDFVDLFLIHSPLMKPEDGTLQELWKAMEAVHAEGLAKSIGVSNFMIDDLKAVLSVAKVVPSVNQMELHPYTWKDAGLAVEYGLANGGITPASYGGLSSIFRAAGGPVDQVVTPMVERLSKEYGKSVTPAHVLFKWILQKGGIVVTTSSKEERLKEYLETFQAPDLTAEDIRAIDQAGTEKSERFYWGNPDKFRK
ncbi:Aldo-ket-red domain-containing protein [Favolaschia claudopus]|uniref:Aldo-ket-red domain-containing protein n=1 Tax=Favolaschia claudopus TaxID=2862362 RepID=A0AAW0C1M7_9AGAR